MQSSGKKVTETDLAKVLTGRELRLYEIQATKDIATVAQALDAKQRSSFKRLYLVSVTS